MIRPTLATPLPPADEEAVSPAANASIDVEIGGNRTPKSHGIDGSRTPRSRGATPRSGAPTIPTPRSRGSRHAALKSHSQLSMGSQFLSEAARGLEPIAAVCSRLIHHHRALLLGSVLLTAIGVVGGMAIEGWDFLTSLYVIAQISTTIGYGDVIVNRGLMQLFMSFYVLAVLFVMANFLNIMLRQIIQRHQEFLQKQLVEFEVVVHSVNNHRDARKRYREFNEVIVSGSIFLFFIVIGTVFYHLTESCTCSYGKSRRDFNLHDCNPESHDTCMATGGIRHTWISALYMSVITVTTIGFGDYSPKSHHGRIFGIVWMLVSVPATAFFIQSVSKIVGVGDPAEKETTSNSKKLASGARQASTGSLAGVDRSVFEIMDQSGTGRLTKAEYTRYVLVSKGFLPIDVLWEIDQKFDSIDFTGSGSITFDMLEEAACCRREALEASHLSVASPPRVHFCEAQS
mmetsp:Transcript_42109/g.112532  ORF Transcript_42109/g.112532 Transcript_42109/m.112532 type:complete len:458 (-) Transcript_42109:367-1740(-)